MNKVILIGRLCADPECSQTATGKTVAKYRLAVDRAVKAEGQPDADFLPCVVWGKGAEFAQRYLRKGIKIAVEGRIQTGSYEKDGVRHYTTDIVVDRHEFCESKGGNAAPPPPAGHNQSPTPAYQPPAAPVDNFETIDDDEQLPF